MSLITKLMLAALGGGAGTSAVWWVIDYAGLRQDAQDRFRDDLMGRVNALEERQGILEDRLETERRKRIRAQLKIDQLLVRIHDLVERINDWRREDGLDPLDPADFTGTDFDHSNASPTSDA